MPNWNKLPEFQAADDAWSAELARQFAKNAGDFRYTSRGRGDPGTPLRALYDTREAAREAWEKNGDHRDRVELAE